VGYAWDDAQSRLQLALEQTQELTQDSPAYVADVDVWLIDESGTIDKRKIAMTQRFAGLTVRCDKEPAMVCVDPRGALLAKYKFDIPKPMLIEQATKGPTAFARLHAIHALADKDDDKVREAMETILLDGDDVRDIRRAAADALGKMQTDDARDILLNALKEKRTLADPWVRRVAVSALGWYRDEKVVATLIRCATEDGSNSVEGDALKGLGNQDPTDEIVETVAAAVSRPELNQWARQAAVEALAKLDDPRGLELAMAMARYGAPYRSRRTGIWATGKLGAIDDDTRDRVRPFLESLLKDRHKRAVDTTIDALVEIGDKKSIPALQTFRESSAPENQRDHARRAIDEINKNNGERDVIRDLRERIKKLEDAREDLEKRVSEMGKAEELTSQTAE
jgi:HEAT repeat protein